jgi:hypothetical protein
VSAFSYWPNSKNLNGLGIFIIFGCVTVAHLYVTPISSGPLLVLDHIFNIMLVLAMLAVCTSAGEWVLARCGMVPDQPIELLLFSLAIGAGILATSILFLGLLSGLQGLTLGLLLLFCALLTRKELLRLPGAAAESLYRLKTHSSILGLVFFGAVAVFMISMAMTPPHDWDSLMYHLRVPAQFLQHGRIYLPEDNLHTAYVGLAHMLYLPLMAFGSESGPALVSAFFALALGLAVFEFCVRFLPGSTADLGLSSLWGSALLLLTAITPKVDVTLAFYLFLAHYALIRALSSSSSGPFVYLSAALLGLATGIKYLALIYFLALVPLIFRTAWCRQEGFGRSVRNLALFSILCLGAASPWLAKNWLLLGSPLYPFLSGLRIEPWLVGFYPNQDDALPVIHQALRWFDQGSARFSLLALIRAPGTLTVEAEGALYYPNPIFLLLPLWMVTIWRNKILNWLMISTVGYVIILAMYWPFNVVRYLTPAVAPFTIVAVHIAGRLWHRLIPSSRVVELSALIVGITLLPFGISAAVCFSGKAALRYVTGMSSAEEFLQSGLFLYGNQVYSEMTFINRHMPQGSRILMVYEGRGYYFNVATIQDNSFTNWPLLARTEAAINCLRRTGISHVLVNDTTVEYFVRRGVDPQVFKWEAFEQFAQRCLIPVHRGQGFVLFRVRE